MKIRALVAAATVVAASFGLVAPAHAWECQRMELCQQTTMTVCMIVTDAVGDPACH